jgi:hypothetical protein
MARLLALTVLGLISSIAYYLGFTRPYQLVEHYAEPLLDLGKLSGYSAVSANYWAMTWLIVLTCYYLAFRICPAGDNVTVLIRRLFLLIICGWAVFSATILVFMYPVGALDIFDQIFRARLTAHYGYNPFITIPTNLPHDPFQPYVAWKGDPSPYGPLWELIAAGTSLLGGNRLWDNLIYFKLLVLLAHWVSIGLTYGILCSWKPNWSLRGTLFFAWNPLVLFELAGNGHNDSIVVAFILAGVYGLVFAARCAVIPFLVGGALTKFVPILLVPIALACIWRDRFPEKRAEKSNDFDFCCHSSVLADHDACIVLAKSLAGALILATAVYLPFWIGPESLFPQHRSDLFTASIPKVLVDLLIDKGGLDETVAQHYVRVTAYALIGLFSVSSAAYVLSLHNAMTVKEHAKLVDHTLVGFYEIIFAYLAIASLWFQPWYLAWLVALTAPLARVTYVNRTLLFCIGGIANYFVWDYIWWWNRTGVHTIQITSALAIYTLPLIYTFYIWLKPRFSRL